MPIRILHVVFSLDPGGMENGLSNLAQRLPVDEFDIHVCCLEREGAFARRFPSPSQIYTLNKAEGFSLHSLVGLARLIARIQPHIVHSHNLGTLIYASLATGGGRWKSILHGEHGQLTGEHCEPRRLRQRHNYFRRCQRLHTVSQSLTDHFAEFGFDRSRFDVIVNGVDVDRFKPGDKQQAKAEWGIPPDAPTIGILGRFGPFKRHDLLLDAFDDLARKLPQARLLIVGGGGPEEDKIQRKARAGLVTDRIHFTGFQEDPRRCYHAMDLLVIPSINEGLSNALLESMASGVPALCNKEACGSDEVIEHGVDGFVADISDRASLAANLVSSLSSPARLIDMGRAARKSVERKFSIDKMVQDYQRIYREIAHQGAR